MERTHVVEALDAPVEVVVDRWGVPHIRARSAGDAFVAQGFTAARDRLFQLDLWRRRGLGLLSQALGPSHVERDRAARLFLYRGDMATEWSSYGEGVREAAERFTAGINAYIRLTELEPDLSGPDFAALGTTPSHWSPEDLCRIRSHGLYANAEKELARALTLRDLGPEAEDLRAVREPRLPLRLPEGFDPDVLRPEVLDVYRLACAPVDLSGARPRPAPLEPDGSNNWVISGERTATGRPLLANDPHRTVGAPALRHITHLSCPEFDVIGAGEPALPGVSIGHNGHVAFGLTIFPIDQEDLYVHELHPDDPGLYRHHGSWRPFERTTERIPVRGGPVHEAELVFSLYGPVVYTDLERRAAVVVRAAWLDHGMAPYLGSVRYMRARDGRGFREALRVWGTPGENQVYADTEGDFGWIAAGRVPVRTRGDGSVPVPGDGGHEWAGSRSGSDLPTARRPASGWFASANENNLGRARAWTPFTVTRDWAPPTRYERIAEELSSRTGWTVEDACRLQSDVVSPVARAALASLGRRSDALASAGPDTRRAWRLLRGWDGSMAVDLPQPTLFEHWFRHRLLPALLRERLLPLVGADRVEEAVRAVSPGRDTALDPRIGLNLLEEAVESGEIGPVARSLALAHRDLVDRSGPLGPTWNWGEHHFARLDHPLARAEDPPAWAFGRRVPRPGGADTVNLTAYDSSGRQYHGASFRIVIDVGGWDHSVAINAPGQSGDPRSPHYDDLTDRWARDAYFPLLYSREAVDRHRTETLHLLPPG